jgi:hypothetical protein
VDTRQGDLQLRVGAAIRTFVHIGGHPKRVRTSSMPQKLARRLVASFR